MNINPAYPTMVESNLISWIRQGKVYSAFFGQTIGAAANGNYAISVFNPANSGKELLVFSIKGSTNFSSTNFMTINTNSVDPNLNTPVTPINMRSGVTALSVANITASSAGIAAPSTNIIEQFNDLDFFNGVYGYLLVPGFGIEVVTFVNNSQQYSFGIKYAEFIGV